MITNRSQAVEIIKDLERYFEESARRASDMVANLENAVGADKSEAEAGISYFSRDVSDYKNAAQRMRDALAALRA